MMSTNTRWSAAGAAICLTAACLLSACSSSAGYSGTSSSGSSTSSVCDQVGLVKASLHNLQTANVSENGMVAMTESLGRLRTELQQLRTVARGAYDKQVATLTSAADQIRADLKAARADPSSESLAAVKASLNSLATAVKSAADAATC
jgi:hypothetical protein